MILESIFNALFLIPHLLIGLLPVVNNLAIPNYLSTFLDLVAVPLSLFPIDLWLLLISNVIFWAGVQISWAGIEWVYKKIPGVS